LKLSTEKLNENNTRHGNSLGTIFHFMSGQKSCFLADAPAEIDTFAFIDKLN